MLIFLPKFCVHLNLSLMPRIWYRWIKETLMKLSTIFTESTCNLIYPLYQKVFEIYPILQKKKKKKKSRNTKPSSHESTRWFTRRIEISCTKFTCLIPIQPMKWWQIIFLYILNYFIWFHILSADVSLSDWWT